MSIILDFSKPALNCPIVERLDAQSIHNSIFYNQYMDTLSMLNQYLLSIPYQQDSFHEQFVDTVTDSNNNIFAFIGERGAGKTSCMLSIASLLLEERRRKTLNKFEAVRFCPFFHVGMIDPSFFDQEHNILSLFLAKMYQSYQKWIQEQEYEIIDQDIQGKLVESFCNAQRHLNFMFDKKPVVQDDLDRLLILSSATDLKLDIYNLIENYKKLRKYPAESKLLLMVDDIDLNVGEGSKMAELIRKYFVQRNVVVLISVKMEQLGMVKKQDFVDAYQHVLQQHLLKNDVIGEMAEHYLAKLVPQAHRIYMPTPDSLHKLQVKLSDDLTDMRNGQLCMTYVCWEIFQKTRYLFYNSSYNVSNIVPGNLRELDQLVAMLNHMPMYRDEDGEHFYNKILFKQYFTVDWVKNHLSLEHQEIVNEMLKEDQFSRLNNKVVKTLKRQYQKIFDYNNLDSEISYILDDANVIYNISVGDVLAVINYLSTRCVTEYDQQFFFFLRTLYSMQMYEAYNLMIDDIENNATSSNSSSEPFLLEDSYFSLSEYDKLISGTFINSRTTPLLFVTDEVGNEINLTYRFIEKNVLKSLYDRCKKDWKNAFSNGDGQLLELMILCIYREGHNELSTADVGYFKSYRKQPIFVFDKFPELGFYIFDLGALMFNLSRIENCYKRFSWGEDVWNESIKNKMSLWSQIKDHTEEVLNQDFSLSLWKSYSCIRNVEILDKFINYIRQSISSVSKNISKTEDAVMLYELYFSYAAEFHIKSYGTKSTKDKNHLIHFKFYNIIAKLFKINKWGNRFIGMFYNANNQNVENNDVVVSPTNFM